MHENRVKKYMSLSISLLTEADLTETAEVVKAAYNVPYSRKDSLQLYLALQSGGSFIAKNNGSVVGFGGALDYGPFAYIGLMSVHPSMQKQGIGGLLLERLLSWLEARACPTILLDANPAGAPLYTRYAFIEDDITVVMQQTQHIPPPQHLPTEVSVLAEKDFPALVAFDAPSFGAERGAVLAAYCDDNPGRVLVARDSSGSVAGYLIVQPRVLGPWVACTPEDAERLLIHALAPYNNESQSSVFVSAHNGAAMQLLTRYGFSQQRDLSHMYKGKPVERSRRTAIFGQASLGLG
jgi:GNAT superfamily N-acetyltransferase